MELRATRGSCLEEMWWDLVMVKSCGCGPETRTWGLVRCGTTPPYRPPLVLRRRGVAAGGQSRPPRGWWAHLPASGGLGANTLPVVPGFATHGGLGEPPVLSLSGCRMGITWAAPRPALGGKRVLGWTGPPGAHLLPALLRGRAWPAVPSLAASPEPAVSPCPVVLCLLLPLVSADSSSSTRKPS